MSSDNFLVQFPTPSGILQKPRILLLFISYHYQDVPTSPRRTRHPVRLHMVLRVPDPAHFTPVQQRHLHFLHLRHTPVTPVAATASAPRALHGTLTVAQEASISLPAAPQLRPRCGLDPRGLHHGEAPATGHRHRTAGGTGTPVPAGVELVFR